ncbi:conserved Plasmodium protein, unknown function [Plasmodium knowlesi strain H]|uniref:Uncharacterized protein n=3 Tax=Plasmodium knowlesi TaxID=5850 RepID=A0A5K1V0R6_PLAKH|nr:conserved Plasmodium protein, unknown function [Plasmodium knowlesi strain H]OTN66341.1 Uncharacterized protein PKNOH_S09542900 [Plasmodium knowlesi]CAA9989884.1 conserved Plasmodium protein, unknown function [Plasmodium knowlesi strain H]SBO24444.1 conserved Plasmodium protein, unknown function [Plasmodium knowlesi strain H]SBO26559.1 conserved Plasmodium protein, unknown function [Plasmodium knowlesi strain H]VVS79358.1 conserved Plasmodium protein, unknown function [Plasmodium knowlesi s|eukprot:XP_002259900.1 hypothetical protein, conserved in Plasmodium species [Plasmodium knowlesi strain H]
MNILNIKKKRKKNYSFEEESDKTDDEGEQLNEGLERGGAEKEEYASGKEPIQCDGSGDTAEAVSDVDTNVEPESDSKNLTVPEGISEKANNEEGDEAGDVPNVDAENGDYVPPGEEEQEQKPSDNKDENGLKKKKKKLRRLKECSDGSDTQENTKEADKQKQAHKINKKNFIVKSVAHEKRKEDDDGKSPPDDSHETPSGRIVNQEEKKKKQKRMKKKAKGGRKQSENNKTNEGDNSDASYRDGVDEEEDDDDDYEGYHPDDHSDSEPDEENEFSQGESDEEEKKKKSRRKKKAGGGTQKKSEQRENESKADKDGDNAEQVKERRRKTKNSKLMEDINPDEDKLKLKLICMSFHRKEYDMEEFIYESLKVIIPQYKREVFLNQQNIIIDRTGREDLKNLEVFWFDRLTKNRSRSIITCFTTLGKMGLGGKATNAATDLFENVMNIPENVGTAPENGGIASEEKSATTVNPMMEHIFTKKKDQIIVDHLAALCTQQVKLVKEYISYVRKNIFDLSSISENNDKIKELNILEPIKRRELFFYLNLCISMNYIQEQAPNVYALPSDISPDIRGFNLHPMFSHINKKKNEQRKEKVGNPWEKLKLLKKSQKTDAGNKGSDANMRRNEAAAQMSTRKNEINQEEQTNGEENDEKKKNNKQRDDNEIVNKKTLEDEEKKKKALEEMKKKKKEKDEKKIYNVYSLLESAAQYFGEGPKYSNPNVHEFYKSNNNQLVYIKPPGNIEEKNILINYFLQFPSITKKLEYNKRRIYAENYGLVKIIKNSENLPVSFSLNTHPWLLEPFQEMWKEQNKLNNFSIFNMENLLRDGEDDLVSFESNQFSLTRGEVQKAGAMKMGAMKMGAMKMGAVKTDTVKIEVVKTDGKKGDEEKTNVAKTDVAKTDAAKTDAVKIKAVKVEAAMTEPVKTETANVEPVKIEAIKIEPAKEEIAKGECMKEGIFKCDAPHGEESTPPMANEPGQQISPLATEIKIYDDKKKNDFLTKKIKKFCSNEDSKQLKLTSFLSREKVVRNVDMVKKGEREKTDKDKATTGELKNRRVGGNQNEEEPTEEIPPDNKKEDTEYIKIKIKNKRVLDDEVINDIYHSEGDNDRNNASHVDQGNARDRERSESTDHQVQHTNQEKGFKASNDPDWVKNNDRAQNDHGEQPEGSMGMKKKLKKKQVPEESDIGYDADDGSDDDVHDDHSEIGSENTKEDEDKNEQADRTNKEQYAAFKERFAKEKKRLRDDKMHHVFELEAEESDDENIEDPEERKRAQLLKRKKNQAEDSDDDEQYNSEGLKEFINNEEYNSDNEVVKLKHKQEMEQLEEDLFLKKFTYQGKEFNNELTNREKLELERERQLLRRKKLLFDKTLGHVKLSDFESDSSTSSNTSSKKRIKNTMYEPFTELENTKVSKRNHHAVGGAYNEGAFKKGECPADVEDEHRRKQILEKMDNVMYTKEIKTNEGKRIVIKKKRKIRFHQDLSDVTVTEEERIDAYERTKKKPKKINANLVEQPKSSGVTIPNKGINHNNKASIKWNDNIKDISELDTPTSSEVFKGFRKVEHAQ